MQKEWKDKQVLSSIVLIFIYAEIMVAIDA